MKDCSLGTTQDMPPNRMSNDHRSELPARMRGWQSTGSPKFESVSNSFLGAYLLKKYFDTKMFRNMSSTGSHAIAASEDVGLSFPFFGAGGPDMKFSGCCPPRQTTLSDGLPTPCGHYFVKLGAPDAFFLF